MVEAGPVLRGGALINQAIHTLDLLLWFLGDPVTVRGKAANLAADTIEVEDNATIVIDHEGGPRSVFFATNSHHTNAAVELEITGRDGTLTLADGELRLTDADGTRMLATDAQANGARSYWGLGHALLIDDFYARLDDPERQLCGGDHVPGRGPRRPVGQGRGDGEPVLTRRAAVEGR